MTKYINSMADVVACLVKEPRTGPELEKLTGIHRQTIRKYTAALEGEGLIKPEHGHRPKVGRMAVLWIWQA